MKKANLLVLFALAGLAGFSSCSDDDEETTQTPQVETLQGETVAVGTNGGTATSWARTTDGKVDQVGVTLNEAAYDALAAETNTDMFMLAYPPEVKAQTGI